MEIDENLYEKIDKYLDGKLEGEELEKFEAEKKSNQALASEIELNAQMKDLLDDSPENELRKNLEHLGNQYDEAPISINRGSSFRSILQVAAAILILVALGWWFMNRDGSITNKDEPIIVDTPETEQKEIEKQDETQIEKPEGSDVVEGTPTQKDNEVKPPIKTPKDSPVIKNQKEKQHKDLYAANYETNPQLDFLINNNLRSGYLEVEVKKQIRNVSLASIEDVVDFQFSGNLKSKDDLQKNKFALHLFSNDKNAFEEFEPISTENLKIVKGTGDKYRFDFQKFILLKPGLYYYVLEDPKIEKIYFVEKFEVRL